MTLQEDVVAYWQGNTTLTTLVPTLWTGLAPESTAFPYAVLVPMTPIPTVVTNFAINGYVEDFTFQISIYSDDPDEALSIADTVRVQFEGQDISARCIGVIRNSGPNFITDQDTAALVYHAWNEFNYQANVN